MEINWSTFVLEIINFLVLVWLLKRFLYAPIQKTIAERKESIRKHLEDAEKARSEAQELQKKYENRLQDWEKEREKKKIELHHEMVEEKSKQMDNLKEFIEQEKEKDKAIEAQRIANLIHQREKELVGRVMQFSSKLLTQFSSQDLENRILDLFVQELHELSPEKVNDFKQAADNKEIKIKTAFELKEPQKKKLSEAFKSLLKVDYPLSFQQDKTLLAGASIEMGSMVLHLNLRDELKFFEKVVEHD